MSKAEKKLMFEVEKETKNTIRFKENEDKGFAEIGTIYVPKRTLAEIGWTQGQNITITVEVSE